MLADERGALTRVADSVVALNDFPAEEWQKISMEVSTLMMKTHWNYGERIVMKEEP